MARRIVLMISALALLLMMAAPAQATILGKSQWGDQWDNRECVKGLDGDGSCRVTYPGIDDARFWADDATHFVRWHFNNPVNCQPSNGCVIDSYAVNVADPTPCNTADTQFRITLFNGQTTKVEAEINRFKESPERQCTIESVVVNWEW